MDLELTRVDSLESIAPSDWNALSDGNPFLRHEFLVALERTRCIGSGTGWEPAYVTARSAGRLVGAMPLYVKYDSRGEFVFDWSWADAYERTGRRYYPKLVAAILFTPATGRRLLVAPDQPPREIEAALLREAENIRDELGASSLHG